MFEPYPQMDKSLLYDWKSSEKDQPLRVNTEVFRLNSFVNCYERDDYGNPDPEKPNKLTLEDSVKGVARIMALSESQMFYLDKKRMRLLFNGGWDNGKKIEGSISVISSKDYAGRLKKYMADPAVTELAKKYMDPAARAELTASAVHENEPSSERQLVEARDPFTIDVKKVRSEYEAVKNKTMNKQENLTKSEAKKKS